MKHFFHLPFLPRTMSRGALCIFLFHSPSFPTALSDAAAGMAPGSWAVLNSAGDGSGFTFDLLNDVGGHNILQYTEDAVWDGVAKRFLYLGQGHSSNWDSDPSTHSKFLVYADNAGQWSKLPDIPTSENNIGHAYDHSALDPATGDFYHRPYSSKDVYKFSAATQTWSKFCSFPGSWMLYVDFSCCMALEFFPEMNGLVLVGNGNVYFYGLAKGAWDTLATGLPMSTVYQSFAEYNPVHKLMVFGGGNGSRDIHKMDSQGKITPLQPAPIGVGITQSIFTCDPVSGKYLVIGSGGDFYEYDAVSDTWQILPGRANTLFSNIYGTSFATVAAPVSTYGVVMFLAWNFQNSKVLLYKHAASSTEEEAAGPGLPALLSVSPNPVSQSALIQTGGAVPFLLYNVSGRQVMVDFKTVSRGRYELDVRAMPAGVYFVRVGGREGVVTRRILVTR